MAWKLFGHATTPAQLPAELRSILAQMQRERVAFEALTAGARDATQQLTQPTQPIAEAQKVVAELQGRVKALERLVPVQARPDEQPEGVSRTQRRTETQVGHTAEEVKTRRTEIEQLRATFDAALALKGDLTGLLESAGGLKSLRSDADTLTGQVRDLSNTFDRARQRQDELNRVGEAAAARLHALEERQQQVQGSVGAAQTRVTGLEEGFAHLTQAAADAADTKRQLGTLKALADYVTQKVAVLEQQREVVDRALGKATQLDDVMRDIDAKIRTHEANAKSLGALETRVTDLQALHGDLLARSREVSVRHDQIAQADQELHGRLNGLRDEVQRTVKRFELENQGLDAVGQRILDLRGGLTDMEARVRSLDESSRTITDVRSRADGLVTQLGGIAEHVAQLETQAERMQAVRAEADRLSQSMAQIEARRQLVEDLNKRLSETAVLGGQLEERTRGLLARMDGADERFQTLNAHADEAARIEKLVPAAVATVERAERRVVDVDAAVSSLEARAQNPESLAERTRALGQELELKQAALDKATEHLGQASQVREQAAAAAQQLEDRTGQLTGALATADGRLIELTATLDELDSRAGNLRFAQKRMAQFEERLAKWEAVESHLTRALEQVSQRQATIDALQADMHRLFEVAERTVDDVRSIAAAKEEVTQTRAMLENVLGLVTHVHDAANGLDHRKRQVEQAEERLGRVEALLADVQSSFEALHGQKALLDQVMEQAGSLEFHAKQAEALIATLREEREITDRVRAAVAQLRQDSAAKSA